MTKTPTLVTPHRATTSTVAHRSDEAFNRHNCRETTFLFQWNVAILVSDRTEFAVAQSEERRRSFELGGDVVFQTTRPCRPWRAIWAAPQWTSCSTWPTWNPPCSWRHCRTWKRIVMKTNRTANSSEAFGRWCRKIENWPISWRPRKEDRNCCPTIVHDNKDVPQTSGLDVVIPWLPSILVRQHRVNITFSLSRTLKCFNIFSQFNSDNARLKDALLWLINWKTWKNA